MKRLVIFDLDGTLLNTVGGIGWACNSMLRSYGFPTHSLESYRMFVGAGARRLLERALPEPVLSDEGFVNEAMERYHAIYCDNFLKDTFPYEGIPELLNRLGDLGVGAAVASNKFDDLVRCLLDAEFPGYGFVDVAGHREGIPAKPDPAMVLPILRAASVREEEVLYVGDTATDMLTARNAGLESVGVTWGFRGRAELEESGACHIADTPAQILDWIG